MSVTNPPKMPKDSGGDTSLREQLLELTKGSFSAGVQAETFVNRAMEHIEFYGQEIAREARQGAFMSTKAACSFNPNCNHCHANQLTLDYLAKPEPRGTAAGNDLQSYDPKADIEATLRRKSKLTHQPPEGGEHV